MATIGDTYPTLADLASRMDRDGGIAKIIEMLNLTNEILDSIVWYEANNGTSHKTTVRAGIPDGTWRILNYGVANEKPTGLELMRIRHGQPVPSRMTTQNSRRNF